MFRGISKARELLEKARTMLITGDVYGFSYQKLYEWIDESLTILSKSKCKTCGGTSEISKEVNDYGEPKGSDQRRYLEIQKKNVPCPDCSNKN